MRNTSDNHTTRVPSLFLIPMVRQDQYGSRWQIADGDVLGPYQPKGVTAALRKMADDVAKGGTLHYIVLPVDFVQIISKREPGSATPVTGGKGATYVEPEELGTPTGANR